jgi:hypothetical protein
MARHGTAGGGIARGVAAAVGVAMALGAMTAMTPAPRHANRPSGIYVYAPAATAPGEISAVETGPFPGVQGFDWTIGWATLEPNPSGPDQYNWSVLDTAVADAAAAGLKSQITVIPGTLAPSWVIQTCPDVTIRLLHTGAVKTIAVPTSSVFLGLWTTFIRALGAHLATLTGITSVQASGLGDQGEMILSPPTSGTWADVGVTTASLLAGWKQVLTAWRTWLPAPVPSALAIEEPLGLGASNVLETLIPWVHSKFKAAMWIQQNALKASTPTTSGYWPMLKRASDWTNTGWQMFGSGTENGDLETAFSIGLASRARYFQVYLSDIVDSTMTPALQYLADHL